MKQANFGGRRVQLIAGYQRLDELSKILKPFSDRVLKENCLDLPEKTYIERQVELTDEQKKTFFIELLKQFSVDRPSLKTALKDLDYSDEGQLRKLHKLIEPKSQELFRRLNQAPNGTSSLLKMRESLLKSIKFKDNKFSKIDLFLKNNLKDINKYWPKKLPNGIIHGDLFIDNIFFKKNKLSGIIDFYFAGNDYFMYEIAICINALCFDLKGKKFSMNKQKIKSLIKGYESIKKISSREKNAINVLCRGAALRYLLTRLYDYSNTPKTALIKIKNPNEYYQKLLTHNSLDSYKDYLPR